MIELKSQAASIFGFLIAVVAIVGTQILGWEWGDGRLVPTLIGVIAAGVAVLFVYRQYSTTD